MLTKETGEGGGKWKKDTQEGDGHVEERNSRRRWECGRERQRQEIEMLIKEAREGGGNVEEICRGRR